MTASGIGDAPTDGGRGFVMLSNTAIEGVAGGARPAARIGALDIARGVAVVAMVVYHSAWDLSELRLIPTAIVGDPGWNVFARAIASSFLLLAGLGLALAHGRVIDIRKLLRRVAVVAAAALLVTVATWIAFPDAYVFFGILHAMAASSLLAVPFVRLPAALTALAAIAVGALPLLASPAFDAPRLAFLGLGTRVPLTNDYVPLVPWLAFVLAGIALGRVTEPTRWLPRDEPRLGVAKALAWLGRHSLVIYLAHQPLIYGALSGVAAITGPNPAAEAAPVMRNCAARCGETGQPEGVCRIACRCTLNALRQGPLWTGKVGGRLSMDEAGQIGQVARSCLARAR